MKKSERMQIDNRQELLKLLKMDVTLIRNGYNLQRRKMYLENPRHNLKSSVQLMWQQSLQENGSQLNKKKEQTALNMKQSYNKAIQKKIEDELKINKSTFRVMPSPGTHKTIEPKNSYYDSLNREIQSQREKKNWFDSPVTSRDNNTSRSQSLSKSVFGYEIDKQVFRKQSYLSRILGDRLEPYMKNSSNIIMPRHQSFSINQPISLQY